MTSEAATLAQRIEADLATRLASGQPLPCPLKLIPLASYYGVSTRPVRQALAQLRRRRLLTVRTLAKVRVQEDIDIMVDCHARPSPRMGLLFAKALEPYNLYFFEEPCWPETIDGIAEIQRAVKTPIATGEIKKISDFCMTPRPHDGDGVCITLAGFNISRDSEEIPKVRA